MRSFHRHRVPIFFGVVFLFSAFQSFMFHEYAVEMSALLAKEAVGLASIRDQKKMGAICNSIERYSCSIRHFEKVLEVSPFDREALGNLAVASAMREDFERAQSYFAAYFAGGGAAADVTYWYARTLSRMGRMDEALQWGQEALAELTNTNEYTRQLAEFVRELESALNTTARVPAQEDETQTQ